MKNWVIILSILLLPIVAFFVLEKNNATKNAFEAQAQTGRPQVIKFYSTMCLDCKKLESVTKEVMPLYLDKVDYKNLNGQSPDKDTELLIQKYNINLVPTMVFVKKDGSLYKKTEGYLTKKELESILDGLIKE